MSETASTHVTVRELSSVQSSQSAKKLIFGMSRFEPQNTSKFDKAKVNELCDAFSHLQRADAQAQREAEA